MKKTFSYTIDRANAGRRLDQFLASRLSGEVSRTALQRVIKKEGVLVNSQKSFEAKQLLKEGDSVEIHLEEAKSKKIMGEKIPLRVIYEDEDLLAIDKPVGMVVHPGAGTRQGTLVHALLGLEKELSDLGGQERPGIVHRLDKETSGILLIAKNNNAHHKLSSQLASRTIQKEYLAVVEGVVEYVQGQIREPLGRDPRHRTRMAVRRDDQAREALTEYEVIERFRYSTFLKVHPVTGRTHQIRVHLKHIGHPVLGDALYGRKEVASRLALHAAKITLDQPTSKKRFTLEASLPEDFKDILEKERSR